ncbi:MAG: hypothetical protein CMA72_09005 [Euryarchaeota archaeon]|jgi:hypothetical protein|nr:hypothetical protein [Euryarchaeota archaeon]|tara:strand:- start:651 stop:1805 length:1155 start_codon:yes stop_codon:yes gene_type:complete
MKDTITQPNHADRGHAEFSPSSLKYVAGCAAYHGKDGTSDAAEMGTRIHEALEVRDPSALHNEKELDIYDRCVEMEDEYLADEFGEDWENNDKIEDFKEIQVDIDLGDTETFGTCDRLTISETGHSAIMGDYKTGISTIDYPRENYQSITYTIGAFQMFPKLDVIQFAFYVPQRGALPQTGEFNRSELPDLIKKINKVVRDGEDTRPLWGGGNCPPIESCNPTQNCRFCRHEDRCPALGGMVLDVASNLARKDFTNINIEDVSDPAAVEELYNISKIVEAWAKRLRSRAVQMAKDGIEFPSLRLKSMGTTSSFNSVEKAIQVAIDMGVSQDDLMGIASLPLRKTATLVGGTAEAGKKKEKATEFIDACDDAGIIKKANERFTLS